MVLQEWSVFGGCLEGLLLPLVHSLLLLLPLLSSSSSYPSSSSSEYGVTGLL